MILRVTYLKNSFDNGYGRLVNKYFQKRTFLRNLKNINEISKKRKKDKS